MFSGVWGDRGRCRVHRREDAGGNDIVSACHIWNIQEKKKWNDAVDADDTQRLGKKKSGGGLNKMGPQKQQQQEVLMSQYLGTHHSVVEVRL